MSRRPAALVAVSVGLALCLMSPATPAQHHTAGWSVITSASSASTAPAIGQIDNSGKMTTVLAGSALPQNVYAQGGTLDFDDRTYVVALLSKAINGSLLLVDRTGFILQTVQVLSKSPANGGGFINDVILDHNGDYIVVVGVGGGATPGLLRVDRGYMVTTVYQGTPLTEAKMVTTDINTGNFLVVDSSGRWVYSIAPDGSAIISVGIFSSTHSLNTQITQDIRTGDMFVGSWASQGVLLFRMSSSGVATTFLTGGLNAAYGVHADRSTAANPRLAMGALGTAPAACFVDLTTKAITTLHTGTTIFYQVFPNREVGTIKRGPGNCEISMHFQGEGGSPYVVGLSLSGVRPGVALPDGRRINLQVDSLTVLSVNGLLGPLFTGYTGTLNAFDRASALLNVSGLPPLKGVRVWAQVVTLNPSAPLGIQTIADPVILVL
jgi:hypothetical protein